MKTRNHWRKDHPPSIEKRSCEQHEVDLDSVAVADRRFMVGIQAEACVIFRGVQSLWRRFVFSLMIWLWLDILCNGIGSNRQTPLSVA